MVSVVAQNNLMQPFANCRDRLVHPATKFCLNGTQLRHHSLLGRLIGIGAAVAR
jgi:hypothetical protein